MKIKMLSTQSGSIDGVRVSPYVADAEYDLTGSAGERDLAAAFIGARMAVEVGTAPAAPVVVPPAEVHAEVEMTSAQLRAALTELGVSFKPNASKTDLKALFDAESLAK